MQIKVNRKTFLGDLGMAKALKPTKRAQIIHHSCSLTALESFASMFYFLIINLFGKHYFKTDVSVSSGASACHMLQQHLSWAVHWLFLYSLYSTVIGVLSKATVSLTTIYTDAICAPCLINHTPWNNVICGWGACSASVSARCMWTEMVVNRSILRNPTYTYFLCIKLHRKKADTSK